MTTWQPIESAPKDGTTIMAWGPGWASPGTILWDGSWRISLCPFLPVSEERPPTLWLGLYGINFRTQQPLDPVPMNPVLIRERRLAGMIVQQVATKRQVKQDLIILRLSEIIHLVLVLLGMEQL